MPKMANKVKYNLGCKSAIMGIVKNQFTAFMEAISHNLKRMVVLHELYPPQTT